MQAIDLRTNLIREALTKTVKMLARDSIAVTQRGAGAYCEFDTRTGKAKRINIPMIPNNPSEEFLTALQGYVDHEVAHAHFTDGRVLIDTKAGTEGAEETDRKAIIKSLVNIVEDVRIEQESMKAYAGAEANLDNLLRFMIDKVWGHMLDKIAKGPRKLSPEDYRRTMLGVVLVPYMRARGGQRVCQEFMDDRKLWEHFKQIDDAIPDLSTRLRTMRSTTDAIALAKEIYRAIRGEFTKPERLKKDKPTPKAEEKKREPKAKPEPKRKPEEPKAPKPADTSEDEEPGPGSEPLESDEVPDADGDDGKEDEKEKKVSDFSAAMKKLKPQQRRALFLYNKKHKTVAQVADLMSKSEEEVERLLTSGRRQLKRLMGKD